jgi:hypothetical protein
MNRVSSMSSASFSCRGSLHISQKSTKSTRWLEQVGFHARSCRKGHLNERAGNWCLSHMALTEARPYILSAFA